MVAGEITWSRERQGRLASIGKLQPVRNPERKERCRLDAHAFLVEYFPETTGLKPFSPEHIDAIERMQNAILHGGTRVLNLFPRGFGKTTISENLAMWAVLYGHRKFVPIIGADENAAKDNIESIKTEFMSNDRFFEDFPEAIQAIHHLENKPQRARSQTHEGRNTQIVWGQDTVVLPNIQINGEWTACSGAILTARGLTGRIRGMSWKRPDGVKQRPDFVIIDDPQTDVSAKSPAQCEKRLSLIRKGVLKLGGHDKQLAAVMNATVIEPDDAVDRLSDHVQHPEWEGVRIPMLKSDATDHSAWMETYADMRRTYNPEDPKDRGRAIEASNDYYRKNRKAMDAGAVATWEHCYYEDEQSAIQHAYNIRIDDGEDVFASECQNTPVRLTTGADFLTASDINRDRVGTWKKFVFPSDVVCVSFHIDVQKYALFWTVLGISDEFKIYPIYGVTPEQKQKHFEYRAIRRKLQDDHPGMSDELALQTGLVNLLSWLWNHEWEREDGRKLQMDRGLVDGGYQTPVVRAAIGEVGLHHSVELLFGRGVKAGDVPLLQRRRHKKEDRSTDAAIPWVAWPDATFPEFVNVYNDTNALKTFLMRRFATDRGLPGCVELHEGDHRRYAEHIASSEYATDTSGPYGQLQEWRQFPGNPDNHWLDTTCGAIVAASRSLKVRFDRSAPQQKPRKRKKVRYL